VFGAPGFEFGRPEKSASEQLTADRSEGPHEKQVWHELPAPTGKSPYRLELASVIGNDAVAAIGKSGRLVFHTIGDTGGIDNAWPQLIVAHWMDKDYRATVPGLSATTSVTSSTTLWPFL